MKAADDQLTSKAGMKATPGRQHSIAGDCSTRSISGWDRNAQPGSADGALKSRVVPEDLRDFHTPLPQPPRRLISARLTRGFPRRAGAPPLPPAPRISHRPQCSLRFRFSPAIPARGYACPARRRLTAANG